MAWTCRAAIAVAAVAALAVAGCGGDDSTARSGEDAERAGASSADLREVKSYLLAHTERLVADTKAIAANADAYAQARAGDAPEQEVASLVEEGQRLFRRANPAYEEMEGIVAGV